MQLQTGEKILKVYHHHSIFFVKRALKIWLSSVPFFFVAYIFGSLLTFGQQIFAFSFIIGIFALVHIYDFVIYYLDTLVITNRRIVHLDWINLFKYVETQAMLDDIQNIETHENGFFANFAPFDFGEFILETASTHTTLHFKEAPSPDEIKFFLYQLVRKQQNLAAKYQNGKNQAGEQIAGAVAGQKNADQKNAGQQNAHSGANSGANQGSARAIAQNPFQNNKQSTGIFGNANQYPNKPKWIEEAEVLAYKKR